MPPVQPVKVQLTMTVREVNRCLFLATWLNVARQTQKWPGFLHQDLSEVTGEPGTFVITSEWASIEAFRAFETDPKQDVLTRPLRRLRVSASMQVLNMVAGSRVSVDAEPQSVRCGVLSPVTPLSTRHPVLVEP